MGMPDSAKFGDLAGIYALLVASGHGLRSSALALVEGLAYMSWIGADFAHMFEMTEAQRSSFSWFIQPQFSLFLSDVVRFLMTVLELSDMVTSCAGRDSSRVLLIAHSIPAFTLLMFG
jgi:hypothetical protein